MANLKRTREDILEAVIDAIHRKGLTATGLSELFRLSGASSGSFYNYFASKKELGHALIDFEWMKLQRHVLEPATACESPIDQIFWILHRLEQKQLDEPFCGGCLLGNLIVDLVEQDSRFRDHLMQIFNKWEGALAQILRQGQEQLRPEVNPDRLAEQLMTVIEGSLLMSKLHRSPDRLGRDFALARQLVKDSLKGQVLQLAASHGAEPLS